MAETRIGVNVVFPFTVDPRQGIRLVGGDSALCGGVILAAGWSTQEEITGFKGDTGEAFADQMVRGAQGLGDEEIIREACMRSGETVDWLISIGKTYDAADILPPIWGLGDTEADILPRSLWMASEIDSDEFETGTSINGHYKTLQDHANTIEELAALINVPADNLKEEIDTWNAYCASGKDLRLAPRGRPERRGSRAVGVAASGVGLLR